MKTLPAILANCRLVPPLPSGAIVFALGEATGHAHQVAVADRPKCMLYEANARTAEDSLLNVRFLHIMDASGIDVIHEEHGTLHLDSTVAQAAQGDVLFTRVSDDVFRVNQQREYQPKALPRRVAD